MTSTKIPSAHPATYSKQLIEPIAEILSRHCPDGGWLLDPFAGLGQKLVQIAELSGMDPLGVEIEPGYFRLGLTADCVSLGDATDLPWVDESFDAAATSPCYPNGMCDNFQASDASIRNTYVHRLRMHLGSDYELSPHNTAALSPRRSRAALEAFYAVHQKAWNEVYRVLRPGGVFVVNTKDTVHTLFGEHTRDQLREAGFTIAEQMSVSARGLLHGANYQLRVDAEELTVAVK